MDEAYKKFVRLMDSINNIKAIYNYIRNNLKAPIDCSDLLRWQWIQSVSAFDTFIHDIVRIGMVEILLNKRILTPKFKTFELDMATFFDMSKELYKIDAFEKRIIMAHSYLSFQDPNKVNDALARICDDKDKWKIISNIMGKEKDECTKTLRNIVIRRNQIVHEGDFTNFDIKQEITQEDTDHVIRFISDLGAAIYKYVTDKKFYVSE